MYSGVFRDVYREFMIQVNEEYLGCRGETTCTPAHPHRHARTGRQVKPLAQSARCENETARGTGKKNRFHYSLYCLVGFVLVALKDVMKLLEDNQQETDSLGDESFSLLCKPQDQTCVKCLFIL